MTLGRSLDRIKLVILPLKTTIFFLRIRQGGSSQGSILCTRSCTELRSRYDTDFSIVKYSTVLDLATIIFNNLILNLLLCYFSLCNQRCGVWQLRVSMGDVL